MTKIENALVSIVTIEAEPAPMSEAFTLLEPGPRSDAAQLLRRAVENAIAQGLTHKEIAAFVPEAAGAFHDMAIEYEKSSASRYAIKTRGIDLGEMIEESYETVDDARIEALDAAGVLGYRFASFVHNYNYGIAGRLLGTTVETLLVTREARSAH